MGQTSDEKPFGLVVIGGFFLLFGVLYAISAFEFMVSEFDSAILCAAYILAGYLLLSASEFGRKLAIALSFFNLFSIGKSFFIPKIASLTAPVIGLGISEFQTTSVGTSVAAALLYALVVYFLLRPEIAEVFTSSGPATLYPPEHYASEEGMRARELEDEVSRLHDIIEQKNSQMMERLPIISSDALVVSEDGKKKEVTRRKIGEILVEEGLVTQEVLNKALEYQKQSGGTITQYLLHYGYIDEKQLVQCLSKQFGIPYLPLSAYDISDEVIKLIPADIAEKYWLVPVDKQGDSLMIVMIDPLDTKLIKRLEDLTGLKIRPFVGIISDIAMALQVYYKIMSHEQGGHVGMRMPPFFVDTKIYKGAERRRSIRYPTKIDVRFPIGDVFKRSHAVNVSREGFALVCDEPIAVGTVMPLEVVLPEQYSSLPIPAVVHVVRCIPLAEKEFDLGVNILKIGKTELESILAYAIRNENGDVSS